MDEAIEYYDFIMTAEICYKIAELHGEYPNKKLKECCLSLSKRATSKRVKLIFKGISKQAFPIGALAKIRREFDEALS